MKALLLAGAALLLSTAAGAADALPSWNEGAARKSIVDFVAAVTAPASRDFVPPAERIATKGWTVVSMKDDWKRIYPDVAP